MERRKLSVHLPALSGLSKGELRSRILSARKALNGEERLVWDSRIRERLLALPEILEADTVYCYADVRNEAGTELLIRDLLSRGVRVALPRVEGKEMFFYYIGGPDDIEPGLLFRDLFLEEIFSGLAMAEASTTGFSRGSLCTGRQPSAMSFS